jgi:hypothetical protein
VRWEVNPEPADDVERAALLAAAEQAFVAEEASAWWRSGLEDLGGFGAIQSVPQEHAARPEDCVLSRARI